ncbi:MAG: OmpA family protein, partial [Cyclobacteriaceae bacterium]
LNGCPDSDEDGVADNEDECPNLAGTIANKGCPEVKDRDGDGIPDHLDNCPDLAAPGTSNGCPQNDRDEDGVPDNSDRCPDVKGLVEMNGCPDTDGDGIADPDDKCPLSAGLKVYNGCPDTDGDGLDDSIDKCPNTPGTVAANGCPEIAVEDRKTLDVAMRAVQFDTGKATFKQESYTILKQIGNILSRYPDYKLAISGHTDNTGSALANQELSEKRAKACYDYLVSQGISSNRMSWAGFGESRPVADNESLNGKSLNRRVEFNMIPK